MLSELELKVVREHKIWGFGAYLQTAWFLYPELPEKVSRGEYPKQEELKHANERMNQQRANFNFCYLVSLPHAEANPLLLEQDAWRLLSPKVKQHVDKFAIYIGGYSPEQANREQLLAHTSRAWDLLQSWNTISKSYKAKLEQNWEMLTSREEAVKVLIRELSSPPVGGG